MKRLWVFGLTFVAVLSFLLSTVPANHSEAEDTYYYARMVEQGAGSEMFHRHHLLYLPLGRGLYATAQTLGFSGGALPVLIGLSAVSGALVILLFSGMLDRAGSSRWWAMPLLFSYGFWRYACAAEIYLPAMALACGAWVLALRSKATVWAVCLASLALLMHLACLPAVLAAGLLIAQRREWSKMAFYYLGTALAVACVYALVSVNVGTVVFADASIAQDSIFSISAWIKGLFAFGHNLLSGNFLFSISAFAQKLTDLFPYRMLQEELFMGRQAGIVWQAASGLTFCVGLIVLAIVSVGALRNPKIWFCPMAFWLAGNVAMALLFEPANPEMWIFVLLPFWFLVSKAWNSVDVAFSKHWKMLAPVVTVAMFLHNAIGGMAFVRRADGDYCQQKGAWVVENADAKDAVIFADSHSFLTYLEYVSPAKVIDAKYVSADTLFQTLEKYDAGNVFVYDDVLRPFPAAIARAPKLPMVGEHLRQNVKPVFESENWTVYEWSAQGFNP